MEPLAQNYTVIAKSPGPYIFCFEPGIVKMPSGRLIVTFPYLSPERRWPPSYKPPFKCPQMNILASDDDGASWHALIAKFNWTIGKPIVLQDQLYLIGRDYSGSENPDKGRDILITRSDDQGESWIKPSKITAGGYWNCPTAHAIRDGHLYWALGAWSNQHKGRETMAVSANIARDILDPAAWRFSQTLPLPEIPPVLVRNGKLKHAVWLEPNVISVNGRLYSLNTVKIYSEDGSQTSGMAAVCEIKDDGNKLDYQFMQYYPMPGGQLKFAIVHDEVSGLFWRTMNLPASVSGAEWGGMGPGDRRILCLSYSLDGLNWMPAGCIAIKPELR